MAASQEGVSMASTPPKRNYGARAGAKKKMRPKFAPASPPRSGLGSAYNSSKDPRGPDAYVPVPDSVGATQRPGHGQSRQAKPGINGYGPGSQFLQYKPGGAAGKKSKPKGRVRRKSGDGWLG
jgi:hypothetical protein